jgi:hypothetical protein
METIHNYLERKSEVGKAETKKVAAGPMHRQSSGPGTMHRQPLGSGPRRGPSQGPGMKRFPDADNELPSNHAVYEHLRKHRATLQQLVAVLKLSANAALIPSSFSSLTMSGCAIKKDPGERKICEWLVRIPVWMRVMQMGKEGPKDGLCAMSFWMPFGWPATSGLASGTVQFAEMFVMYVKYRAYCRAVFQADSCDETELEEAYQLELKNGVKNCQNMVVRIKDGAIETPPSDPELKKFLTDISPGGFSTTSTNGAPAHDVPFSLSHVNSDALEALNCKDIVDGSMLWSPELMPIECQLTALKKSGKALQCKGNFPDDSAACKLLGLHSQFGYKKGSKQNQKLRGMPEFKVGAVQKEGPMMDDREFRGRFFDEVRSGTSLAAVAVRKHFLAPDDCYSILLRHYMLPAMGRRVELRVVVNNVHDLSTECKITAVAKGRIRSEQQQFLPLSGGATGYVNYFYPAKEELEYEVTAECDWADLLVVSEPEKAGEDTPATGKNPGKTVVNE